MPIESSRKCWSCGRKQSTVARFCSQCGTYLGQPEKESAARASVPPTERRQLTVMFCDLVGSTLLSLELDPERYTELVSFYRDACSRVVRQWKGYVARYAGDGILFYFGYPKASEDDALRAAAAAWELALAIPQIRLPGQMHGVLGRPLQVRIGLHTGLAVVGGVVGRESAEVPAVLGAAPNIAAGLQALGQPGDVVVSEATTKLLPSSIGLQLLELREASANKTGVRPYLITAMPQPLVRSLPEPGETFVGRTSLLARMLSSIEDAGPQGVRYLLVGDPGIGKSRLVQEVICHPKSSTISWLEYACSPFGQHSPLHAFAPLLAGSQIKADQAADAAPASTAPAEQECDGAPGNAPADMSPFERRQSAFAQLKLAILTHGTRVGLVLEDFHWADPTTRDFISLLLSAPDAAGLSIFLTARGSPTGGALLSSGLIVECLEPLLPGDAAELAKAIAGEKALSAFEVAEIVDRA